jgi:hypothetical protein
MIPHYSLINGEIEDFTEIPVSGTMITDHSPDLYYKELHILLKNLKQSEFNATFRT